MTVACQYLLKLDVQVCQKESLEMCTSLRLALFHKVRSTHIWSEISLSNRQQNSSKHEKEIAKILDGSQHVS